MAWWARGARTRRRTLRRVPHPPWTHPDAATLFVIGGAEDRLGDRTILRELVRRAGGDATTIAVVATASSLGEEILDAYETAFLELGVATVRRLRPETREQADDPAAAAALEGVDAVFLTGGNQLKLSAVITGTRFGGAIHEAYHRGAIVAGTSAGASVMSTHMVAFGDESDSPRQGITQMASGLGLLSGVVIDQHFDQRSRYGRLLSLVARSPDLLGVGVDEDTAAIITGGHVMDVIGAGCVFAADASRAVTDAHQAEHGAPLLLSGVVVHTLPAGAQFDLDERRLVAFEEPNLAHQLLHQTEENDS